jgi:prephenate dehydrogenase
MVVGLVGVGRIGASHARVPRHSGPAGALLVGDVERRRAEEVVAA